MTKKLRHSFSHSILRRYFTACLSPIEVKDREDTKVS